MNADRRTGAQAPLPEATPTAVTVVALAFLFNFLGRGVADAFSAFILPLEAEFGWSRQSMTGVFASYMLMAGLASPATGALFDRFGPRVVYSAGLALLGGGAWLAGRIDSLWQLYASAGLMVGTGVAALGMVCAATLIGRWFTRSLATAISIAYSGFGCGILLMLPLVQYLIDTLGWRGAYQAVGLFVLALVPICLALPWGRLAGRARAHLAVAGAPASAGPDTASGATGDRPVDWTLSSAMRSVAYWRLVQVFFFTSVGIYCVSPQIVAFLTESGFTPIAAASAFGFAGLLSTGGMIVTGWLADRLGFARAALLSFGLTSAGILGLLAISYQATLAALVGYVLFFGIAQGARGPIVSTMSNRIFAGRSAGTIYGTIYAAMSVGGACGSLAGGVLHDATGGYRAVFLMSLAAIALAAEPFRPGGTLAGAIAARRAAPRTPA